MFSFKLHLTTNTLHHPSQTRTVKHFVTIDITTHQKGNGVFKHHDKQSKDSREIDCKNRNQKETRFGTSRPTFAGLKIYTTPSNSCSSHQYVPRTQSNPFKTQLKKVQTNCNHANHLSVQTESHIYHSHHGNSDTVSSEILFFFLIDSVIQRNYFDLKPSNSHAEHERKPQTRIPSNQSFYTRTQSNKRLIYRVKYFRNRSLH